MLSVASLPGEILQAIGAAKAIGRDRWFELKVLFEKPSRRELALRIIKENNFVTLARDERFNTLMQRLKHAADSVRTKPEAQKRNWASKDGSLAAEMKARGNQFTLALKAKGTDAKAFGNYLSENLSKLYDDFRQDKRPHKNGD